MRVRYIDSSSHHPNFGFLLTFFGQKYMSPRLSLEFVATLFTNCTFWTRRVPLKVFIAVVVARKFQTPLTKNLINKVGRYILFLS